MKERVIILDKSNLYVKNILLLLLDNMSFKLSRIEIKIVWIHYMEAGINVEGGLKFKCGGVDFFFVVGGKILRKE